MGNCAASTASASIPQAGLTAEEDADTKTISENASTAACAITISASPTSGKKCDTLRVQIKCENYKRLVLVHAALGLCRTIPFAIALIVSGSLEISLRLAGQFLLWMLATAIVDFAAVVAFGTHDGKSNFFPPTMLVIVGGYLPACLVCSAFSSAIKWLSLGVAFLVLTSAAAPFVVWRCQTKHITGRDYAHEAFFYLHRCWIWLDGFWSVVINVGLLVALSCFTSGAELGMNVETQWLWSWFLQAIALTANVAMCGIQIAACRAQSRAHAQPKLSSSSPADCADERRPSRCMRLSLPVSSSFVVASLALLWRLELVRPGIWDATAMPAPACEGCHCFAHNHTTSIRKGVVYGTVPDPTSTRLLDLLLDVHEPQGDVFSNKTGGGRPAIVMIHGGATKWGSRYDEIQKHEAVHMAKHGFVVFNIEYRTDRRQLLPQLGDVRNAIHDAKAAIRFVRRFADRFGVDTSRIATWGSSAGAIISASQELVDEGQSGNPGFSSDVAAHVGLSGCLWPWLLLDVGGKRALSKQTPWFNVHGTDDKQVLPFMAQLTYHFFRILGYPPSSNILAWIPNGNHEAWREATKPGGQPPMHALRRHIMSFLVQSLKLQERQC